MQPKPNELELEIVKRRTKKHSGLSGLFKYFRKRTQYSYWSDMFLLSAICRSLIRHELPFSKWEVYRAFQLVDKSEFHAEEKKEIISWLMGHEE